MMLMMIKYGEFIWKITLNYMTTRKKNRIVKFYFDCLFLLEWECTGIINQKMAALFLFISCPVIRFYFTHMTDKKSFLRKGINIFE